MKQPSLLFCIVILIPWVQILKFFLPSPSGPATLLVLFRRGSTKVLGGLAGQVIVILSDGITALLPALICNFALCDNPLKRSLIVCFKCSTNLLLKFSLVIITLSRTLLYMCIVVICFKWIRWHMTISLIQRSYPTESDGSKSDVLDRAFMASL